jgi:ATP-dependent RNA helicase DDX31/DBP7
MQDFDDGDDNFMMNINMNSNGGGFNIKTDKKKEKKEKYLERKLLQNKRKRDKNDEKNLQRKNLKNQEGEGNKENGNDHKNDGEKSDKPQFNKNKKFDKSRDDAKSSSQIENQNNEDSPQKNKFNKHENKGTPNRFNGHKKDFDSHNNKKENNHPNQQNQQSQQNSSSNTQGGDELIDELNEFYESKNQHKYSQNNFLTRDEKNKKKRELQKEIKDELREISEENKLQEESKAVQHLKISQNKNSQENTENPENPETNTNQSIHINPQVNAKDTIFSVKNFDDLDINKYLKKSLEKNNFTQMTKVQKKGIPILLKHKNVVVKSETGSGKTLAYVVPVFEYLSKLNEEHKIDRRDGVFVIIFAPTHELCLQIEQTFDKLKSSCINAVYGTLMGGQKIEREKQKLRKGLNIIISTPGRLLYHLRNTQNVKFDKLKMLIFDEADRLLDMGFERDIKECLSIVTKKVNFNDNQNFDENEENFEKNEKSQKNEKDKENTDSAPIAKLDPEMFKKLKIFLISATIDHKIRKLAEFLMKGFKTVGFDLKTQNEDDEYVAAKGLNQYYSQVYDEFRLITLISFIRSHQDKKIIVFASTCDTVNLLYEMLSNIEIEKNIGSIKRENLNVNNFNTFENEKNEKNDDFRNKKFSRNRNDRKNGNKIDNNLFASKNDKNSKNEENSNSNTNQQTSPENMIKLFKSTFYRLHGKMDHNQRKQIFREFNTDKPGVLISTDVASRGLDFPMVDWIVHYDINPDGKEYLNRMGRSARLDQTGNSLLFLMEHEMPLLETCFKPFVKDMKEMKCGSILLQFVNKINDELLTDKIKQEPEPYKDEVDQNEKFRKKYFFAIHPLQRSIKSYLFKSREFLMSARKAFKGSVRSYATFMKFQKDIFNVKMLNLTRYVSLIKFHKFLI